MTEALSATGADASLPPGQRGSIGMRGKIVGEGDRIGIRKIWAEHTVPDLMDAEIRPVAPLLDGREGIVALDVGANKGYWAKGFLRVFGDRVRHVHMVEPSPENCGELLDRTDNLMFDAKDFDRLSVRQVAMGASEGQVTLFTNEDGSPLASLYPHPLNGYSGALAEIDLSVAIDVPMMTVDGYLGEVGCEHVDIMKLDVEGHELAVLQGAERALANSAIDIVSLEFGVHQVESRHFFKDFYTFLSDYGFSLYFIRGSSLEEVVRYEYRFEDFSTNFQLVGARRRRPAARDVRVRQTDDTGGITVAEASHLRHAAAIAVRERDKSMAAIRTLRGEHVAFRRAHALELAALKECFEQSSSWKLTRPLREVVHALRMLKRKLD